MTKEAPEKIYIDDPTGEFDNHWSMYPNNNSIEYTNTDALIDKACEWMESVLKDLVGYNCAGDLIRDFKKLMEEEEKAIKAKEKKEKEELQRLKEKYEK